MTTQQPWPWPDRMDAMLAAPTLTSPLFAVPGLLGQAIAFLPRITPCRLITSMSGRHLAPKAAQ